MWISCKSGSSIYNKCTLLGDMHDARAQI